MAQKDVADVATRDCNQWDVTTSITCSVVLMLTYPAWDLGALLTTTASLLKPIQTEKHALSVQAKLYEDSKVPQR